MSETKATLLVVEDDLDIAEMLNAYFRTQGYDVLTANWGEDGIRSCLTDNPDLVILDIRLPDVDGFEVARRLRGNRKTKNTPIIFLTEKRERTDRLKGLELKADDYVTKPFDIQELRLRVRNALQRSRQGTLTNPVSGLAEGSLVDEALLDKLSRVNSAAMVIHLQNIYWFREVYGFVASDDLLRAVAIMIQDAVRDLGGAQDFVGQWSGVDFLILTESGTVSALRDRIQKRLEQSFDYFYSDKDREQGTFREKPLGVQISDLILSSAPERTLSSLKSELDRICNQANLR